MLTAVTHAPRAASLPTSASLCIATPTYTSSATDPPCPIQPAYIDVGSVPSHGVEPSPRNATDWNRSGRRQTSEVWWGVCGVRSVLAVWLHPDFSNWLHYAVTTR